MPLPAVLALAGAAVQAGTGIAQSISGGRTAREARDAINSYQRQDLTNLAENLPLRTEAQQFQAQQQDQTLANVLNVLQQGGSFGNVTAITNQALTAKQNIAATIQQQRNRLDDLRLQEEQKVRQLQEQREIADLQGLGAQLQYGNQQRQQGLSAIGAAGGTLLKAAGGGLFKGNTAAATTPAATTTVNNPAAPGAVTVQEASGGRINIPSTFNVF